MSKETELSDEQIDGCWDGLMPSGNGKSRYDIARAIIAADRELRRGGAAMTVAQWQKRHPDEEAGKWQNTDEFDAKWWRDNSRAWEVRSLIATEDAQAALAAMTEKGAKAWADVPDATAWVDELRGNAPVQPVALPAGMPEPVAWIAEYGGDVYTAAQVQAMLSQGLAPGWQAVPVEPTPKMVDSTFRDDLSGLSHNARNKFIYRDMLAAAPKPPAAQSSPTAVERKPLTVEQDEALIRLMVAALENHQGNWADIGKMMGEWLAAAPQPQQVAEPAITEPGWICKHSQYGTWFISRAAVIADWKRDQKHAYPEKLEAEPANKAVDTWLNEQTSWAEIGVNGKQLARPDMSGHEAAWREEMTRNTDLPEMRATTPKEPS